MGRDKAEQYVWQITDLHNNIGDEYGAVDLLNEYANQRVIEELEDFISTLSGMGLGADITSVFNQRIKELKQD